MGGNVKTKIVDRDVDWIMDKNHQDLPDQCSTCFIEETL